MQQADIAQLNADVTLAILEAESADRDAAERWERVRQCEQALVDATAAGSFEHTIALGGADQAAQKAAARRNHR